jgi:heterodisulfide reductase subunit B2
VNSGPSPSGCARRYALFLGCTAPVRAQSYEVSSRLVAARLGIDLVDLPFTCCGFPVDALDSRTGVAMSARNLALAEQAGLDIATICSGCAGALEKAHLVVCTDPEARADANRRLAGTGLQYTGRSEARHLVRILFQELGSREIARQVTRPLTGLRIAAYYGCHYTRPTSVTGAVMESESPYSLDELVSATGAESLRYNGRDKCCGGFLIGSDEATAIAMTNQRLQSMKAVEPDAIVLVCPFCGLMLDSAQAEVESRYQVSYRLPVLYYPQLLGLSLGMSPAELGFELHRVDTRPLLERLHL